MCTGDRIRLNPSRVYEEDSFEFIFAHGWIDEGGIKCRGIKEIALEYASKSWEKIQRRKRTEASGWHGIIQAARGGN
jgi:hypothetical protein